jgi:hypothetical protein
MPAAMRTRVGILAVHAWAGLSLAGLFLYPLGSVLGGTRYYLQWQSAHAAEALATLVALALVFGSAWALAGRARGPLGALAHAAVASVPLASLGVAAVAELGLRGQLVPLWNVAAVRYGVPLVTGGLLLPLLALRPQAVTHLLRATVAILSPIALLVAFTIARTAWRDPPVTRVSAPGSATSVDATGLSPCRPVLAFLFDELSFSYLYDGREVSRDLPAFHGFSQRATHHLSVAAPGRETLVSLPGLLASRRVANIAIREDRVWEVLEDGSVIAFDAQAPSGLFATARRLGFRTEMAGYYFAYCDLLGPLVDACASYSYYNTASVRAWSPLNPALTTLVLWPRQFPFGLLKNPVFARQQRDLVASTLPFAAAPLDASRPVFRFVHFSVPHLPFAFDARGFAPPLDPLRTSPDDAYVRQVAYVDRLVGDLLARLDRDPRFAAATVAVLSDHGFRFGGRERDPMQIPFIVRHPGQRTRVDVTAPEHGEILLRDIVTGACR